MDAGKSNIFWGLIVKPSKRYETTVQEAFRITKACIEPASAKGDVSSVFVECDNQEEFIVANLQSKNLNECLDLTFGVGEKICFKVEGPGTVHLTGYLMEDDQPPNDFYMDDSAMEDSGESEDEEVQTDEKEALKRKTGSQDEVKKKKLKLETESKQESTAKAKQVAETSVNKESEDDSSEDDSSDEDSSEPAETTIDTTLGDLDDTENFAEEEDSDSQDDDDSDDSDEEVADTSGANITLGDTTMGSDDDSSDDEEYTPPPKKESPKKEKTPSKGKANGDAKPVEQNKKPAIETPAKTPDVTKSEKKKKANSTETPKKASIVNGDSDISKSEKKKKKEANVTPNVKQEAPKTPKQEKKDKEPKTPKQAETPKDPKTPLTNGKTPKPGETPGKTPKRTLKGGIQSEDSVVGSGPEVTPGSVVGMYYSGKLKSNNKNFDSCKEGKPFKFKIGKGEVIKGWDIGVMGMKVGGKRTLVIPPQMGYGGAGAPPDIPGNATLVFDVECKFVK